jgi:hypothetical protein
MVLVHRQGDLLEVARALGATGRLTAGLHGRYEQGSQHGDDRDDDQELDQSETAKSGFHGGDVLEAEGREHKDGGLAERLGSSSIAGSQIELKAVRMSRDDFPPQLGL